MEQIVKAFKALSDETRLKILIIISKRNICAKGISRHLNISEAAVSQHIKTLKDAGIIIGEKTGYYVNYKLQESIFLDIKNFINELSDDSYLNYCELNLNPSDICKKACEGKKTKCCQKNNNIKEI
ncbi:MAG: ArsR/SmtB family transcription factor [Clostridiaceae bacterium]